MYQPFSTSRLPLQHVSKGLSHNRWIFFKNSKAGFDNYPFREKVFKCYKAIPIIRVRASIVSDLATTVTSGTSIYKTNRFKEVPMLLLLHCWSHDWCIPQPSDWTAWSPGESALKLFHQKLKTFSYIRGHSYFGRKLTQNQIWYTKT